MIDIETLDDQNTAAIISIGAVVFNPETKHVEDDTFHVNIDWDDAARHGTHSEKTMAFWNKQPVEALETLFTPAQTTVSEAVIAFSEYVRSWNPGPKYIWGNSPAFDVAILRHAFKQTGHEFPFVPWVEMDVRTLKNLLPLEHVPKKDGVNHSAVDDCRWQCKIVQIFHGVDF